MAPESAGDPAAPLWLIGDSLPGNWAEKLAEPLDARHPARHSIWTPILDAMQDALYPRRLRREAVYIRNAVPHVTDWGLSGSASWPSSPDIFRAFSDRLATLLAAHKPPFLLTFGARAAHLGRIAIAQAENRPSIDNPARRSTEALGAEFNVAVERFSPTRTNLLPLLHATIARGRFLEAHRRFVSGQAHPDTNFNEANYFEHTGRSLARLLLDFPPCDRWWRPPGK